jgi:hypothetical protein
MWAGSPRLRAGRDVVAGGTWLGANENGLVVAITNRRAQMVDPQAPSRGGLCLGALQQRSVADAHAYATAELARHCFNPFNLLCVDGQEAWVATWQGGVTPLGAGIHVVVSRGDVDDPAVPRVRRGYRLATRIKPATLDLNPLLEELGRICANRTRPDPICRPGGTRGTVSSSLIAVDRWGNLAAYWHADGPPTSSPYVPVADAPVGEGAVALASRA